MQNRFKSTCILTSNGIKYVCTHTYVKSVGMYTYADMYVLLTYIYTIVHTYIRMSYIQTSGTGTYICTYVRT